MSRPYSILLLGGNGQLGHDLATDLCALGVVRTLTRSQVDLSSPENLHEALAKVTSLFTPDVIS